MRTTNVYEVKRFEGERGAMSYTKEIEADAVTYGDKKTIAFTRNIGAPTYNQVVALFPKKNTVVTLLRTIPAT